MNTYEVLRALCRLGYRPRSEARGVRLEWHGPGMPDRQVVRPLLEIVKARQGEALVLLEAEMAGENPSCKTCPWCMDNPWSRYPDLPLWCGYWWDYLRADSGWCYERRHGQVPDPQLKAQGNEPVRSPTSHDPARAIDSPLTCFECAHFQASEGENPPQTWGWCLKTGRGRCGRARVCDAAQ